MSSVASSSVSEIDHMSETAILLFVGIPLVLTALILTVAVIYSHRKRKQRLLLLELPRSQRSGTIVLVSESSTVSQKQKLDT